MSIENLSIDILGLNIFAIGKALTKFCFNFFALLNSEITEFLAILTQAARRNDEEPYTLNVSAEKNKVPKTELFKIWRTSDWKCFRENLVKIQTSMLRSDATASIDEILSKEGENKEIDPAREVSGTQTRMSLEHV